MRVLMEKCVYLLTDDVPSLTDIENVSVSKRRYSTVQHQQLCYNFFFYIIVQIVPSLTDIEK